MQGLYSYFNSADDNINAGERELMKNIARVEELFLYQLSLLTEIHHVAYRLAEDSKLKHIPSKEEQNPNLRFIENKLLVQFSTNREFKKMVADTKVSWTSNPDLPRRIFSDFRAKGEYPKYLESPASYTADRAIIMHLAKKFLFENELLMNIYEEMSIFWVDDIDLANVMLFHVIKNIEENFNEDSSLKKLYHESDEDEKADLEMARDLFRKTIHNSQESERYIADKTKNWEVERIAQMDILLMKMALCEITEMPSIPVKVTLNEYIDISKMYSTPKSNVFINGVLDKIIADLKEHNKIHKTGRGLMQ
jgi:transcription antitermination protein NusB